MISIDKEQMMIEQYQSIDHVDGQQIDIQLKKRYLSILGKHLKITAMSKDEIMIHGEFEVVKFHE